MRLLIIKKTKNNFKPEHIANKFNDILHINRVDSTPVSEITDKGANIQNQTDNGVMKMNQKIRCESNKRAQSQMSQKTHDQVLFNI